MPLPPLGGTRLVVLECQGTVPGPRFLDGQTQTASVGVAPFVTPPFSGMRWLADEAAPTGRARGSSHRGPPAFSCAASRQRLHASHTPPTPISTPSTTRTGRGNGGNHKARPMA